MTSLLKAKVEKVKDLFGRRVRGYKASIGPVEVDAGKSPRSAAEAAERRVLEALRRIEEGTGLVHQHGMLAVISPDLMGWGYLIIRSGSETSAPVFGFQLKEEAITSARLHIAQTAWTPDVEDDNAFMDVGFFPGKVRLHFRSELESWIRFQRAYHDLKVQHPDWTPDQLHQGTFNTLGELRVKQQPVTAAGR